MKILIFSSSFFEIASFARALIKTGNTVIFAPTEDEANVFMEELKIDVLLSDERKLEWVKQLVAKAPTLNIALFSDMEDKRFHQMTEGFGILMKLPLIPEKFEAELLLERLQRLTTLLAA